MRARRAVEEGAALHFVDPGWRRIVPSLATGLTLLLGLGAIEAARFGDPELGLRFVLLAVMSDGIDGVLARRWGVDSGFGGHLDSLADLIAFGVAPGMLFAAVHPEAPGPIRVLLIAAIAIAGAWRLARFQVEPSGDDFAGLPITVGGPLFALAVVGVSRADLGGAFGWGLAIAFLMVSRVPYPRFTRGKLGRLAWTLAVVFLLLVALDSHLALLGAQVGLATYAAWGLAREAGHAALGQRAATGGRGRGG